MLKKYYPNQFINKYDDIDLDEFSNIGIKGFVFDIDNTLVSTHTKEPDAKLLNWIENIKKLGFKMCIVSNASKQRVELFNRKMKLNAISRAGKPLKHSFIKAAKVMEVNPEEVAVIGDQIFCDISGGNKANMITVLVKPICKKELWFVQLKRIPEKFILKRIGQPKK